MRNEKQVDMAAFAFVATACDELQKMKEEANRSKLNVNAASAAGDTSAPLAAVAGDPEGSDPKGSA